MSKFEILHNLRSKVKKMCDQDIQVALDNAAKRKEDPRAVSMVMDLIRTEAKLRGIS